MKTLRIATIALAATSVLAGSPGFAQDAPIEFRMAPSTRNPAPCMRLDSSMSRVHTFTMMGDHAIIKSAGGIDDRMRQTAPKVYETTMQLQQVQLKVVADASKTPRTLVVTDQNTGCRWDATTP
jgi:hypothetical protein